MYVLGVVLAAVVIWWVWRAQRGRSRRRRAPAPRSPRRSAPRNADAIAAGTRPIAPTGRVPGEPIPARDGAPDALGWYGAGETLTVSGFKLRGPLVYSSPGRRGTSQGATDPSEIVQAAPVSRPRGELEPMGYWPWYSRIEPEWRHRYLEWLASGKGTLPPAEGLLFLYYYGLERRLLVDGEDRAIVLREIVRLRKLDTPRVGTREGESFRGYSTGLLWFEVARSPEQFDEKAFAKVCGLTERWSEAIVPAPLAWLARAGKPLPADLALQMARLNPRARQSVVVRRVGDEFRDLFSKRYAEQFGAGLALRNSKRVQRFTYRPASGGLREVACSIVGPAGILSQFEPLADLWNGCIEDLRRLSKVTIPGGADLTPEVWDALPLELREGVEHPLAAAFQELVQLHYPPVSDTEPGGHEAMVPAGKLARVLGIAERAKLTAVQSRRIAETVHQTGFGAEPDARLTGRTYSWEEPVAVFPLVDTADVDVGRYLAASCMLRLGLVVAEADGRVDEEELRHLNDQIDAVFGLPAHEHRRLEALRAVLLKSGAALAPIAKQLEAALTPDARRAVGRLLVAIAAASAGIDRKELTALRKCFRALSLPPELLDATIAELAPGEDAGFVTVQEAAPGARAGEPIPAAGLRLNREAICAIMADTREVARLLADAMAVPEEEGTGDAGAIDPGARVANAAPTAAVVAVATSTAGASVAVPPRLAGFLADLRARASWPRAEAEVLARAHGLMLGGAVEGLNDWAFDTLGSPLIDDGGDVLDVDCSRL